MSTFNKTILVGFVGQDPVIFDNSDQGSKKAQFSLATNEGYRDKKTGEKVEKSEWHNIVCWSSLAEVAEKFVKKGDLVLIEGKKLSRKYNHKTTGQEMIIAEVQASHIEFIKSCSRCSKNPDGSKTEESFIPERATNDLPF